MSGSKRASKTKAPLKGICHLAGAGPGDLGLVTLRVRELLEISDVIVFDYLCNPEMLKWARTGVEIIYAGKKAGQHTLRQEEINALLVEKTKEGNRVLRLKGGDPFVFGRGGEEAQTLVGHGIPIRIIPGISAGIGGLAYAGIPVTHRDVNQSVTFVTGHDQSGNTPSSLDWVAIGKASEVIVIYMGMKHAGQIAAALISAGRSLKEPVAIVTSATTPQQSVLETTLDRMEADIADAGLEPPAIICVGRTVLMRQVLDWQSMASGILPRSIDPLGRDATQATA